MAKGDHIYKSIWIDGNPFTHHGIDCGDGFVIEHQGMGKTLAKIRLDDFCRNATVRVKKYKSCDSPEVVVRRAYDALANRHDRRYDYWIHSNNCEHFASWCKTGIAKSEQVGAVQVGVGGLGSGGAAAAAVVVEGAVKNSLNPISKALVKVGLQQSPKLAGQAALGIAGSGGLASGLATDFVVEKLLEDDHSLSRKEREAREAGRVAGKVGTAVGAVGGAAAGAVIGGAGAVVAGAVAAPVVLGLGAAFAVYKLWQD